MANSGQNQGDMVPFYAEKKHLFELFKHFNNTTSASEQGNTAAQYVSNSPDATSSSRVTANGHGTAGNSTHALKDIALLDLVAEIKKRLKNENTRIIPKSSNTSLQGPTAPPSSEFAANSDGTASSHADRAIETQSLLRCRRARILPAKSPRNGHLKEKYTNVVPPQDPSAEPQESLTKETPEAFTFSLDDPSITSIQGEDDYHRKIRAYGPANIWSNSNKDFRQDQKVLQKQVRNIANAICLTGGGSRSHDERHVSQIKKLRKTQVVLLAWTVMVSPTTCLQNSPRASNVVLTRHSWRSVMSQIAPSCNLGGTPEAFIRRNITKHAKTG
jgi:hypothetical protein